MTVSPLPSIALVLALLLAGCVSESADIGHPPPVVLETPRLAVDAPARTTRNATVRARILQAIARIGDGDMQSVRIRVYARSARAGEGLRRMLVGMGLDPARLTVDPRRSSANRLVLTRTVAETTPCAAAIDPVDPDDPLPSLMSLARCTQTNNLADMLVDPGDLVAPPRLAAQDGDYLVDGVKSWRQDRKEGLPTQDTTGEASAGSSDGSGTGLGTNPTAAYPVTSTTGATANRPATRAAPAAITQ